MSGWYQGAERGRCCGGGCVCTVSTFRCLLWCHRVRGQRGGWLAHVALGEGGVAHLGELPRAGCEEVHLPEAGVEGLALGGGLQLGVDALGGDLVRCVREVAQALARIAGAEGADGSGEGGGTVCELHELGAEEGDLGGRVGEDVVLGLEAGLEVGVGVLERVELGAELGGLGVEGAVEGVGEGQEGGGRLGLKGVQKLDERFEELGGVENLGVA